MAEENEDRLARIENLLNRTITEFDGHMQTILRLMGQRFDAVDKRLDGMDKRFDKVDLKLSEVEEKLDGVIGVVNNWKREPPPPTA